MTPNEPMSRYYCEQYRTEARRELAFIRDDIKTVEDKIEKIADIQLVTQMQLDRLTEDQAVTKEIQKSLLECIMKNSEWMQNQLGFNIQMNWKTMAKILTIIGATIAAIFAVLKGVLGVA